MLFGDRERIVFAGDSVTDMDRARPCGEGLFENVGHSYVRVVENLLTVFYPERLIRVTNMGWSGNTSRDLLARFQNDVVALSPDWVSICIGINDVWRQFDTPAMPEYGVQPDEYERNVRAMLEALQGKVKGVFLLTPYYMEPLQADPMRRRMDTYGAVCRRLSEEYNTYFVDLQATFDRFFRYRHSASVAWDRVHPNQVGATLIARAFLEQADFNWNRIPPLPEQ